jgi:hypothetical protein
VPRQLDCHLTIVLEVIATRCHRSSPHSLAARRPLPSTPRSFRSPGHPCIFCIGHHRPTISTHGAALGPTSRRCGRRRYNRSSVWHWGNA